MTSPAARRELRLALAHLRSLGRITTDEFRELEQAIQSTGRNEAKSPAVVQTMPRKLLTRAQVAGLLEVSTRTLDRMERNGEIRAIKVSKRSVRYRADDVEALMQSETLKKE